TPVPRSVSTAPPPSQISTLSYTTLFRSLSLYHVEPHRYTEDHRRLLERIAEQAGAVIHNSIVFEQTQEDSLTDPLTAPACSAMRSEEHTSELQSRRDLVCRLLLEKKKQE